EVEKIGEEMRKLRLRRKRREDVNERNRVDFGGRRSLMRQLLRGNQGQGRSSMMLRKKLEALRNYR
ncbi:hypothetical protein Dimus_005390, partial [Dionaea muscipula]